MSPFVLIALVLATFGQDPISKKEAPVDPGQKPPLLKTAPSTKPSERTSGSSAPVPGPKDHTPIALDFKSKPVAVIARTLNERSGGLIEIQSYNEQALARPITLESREPVPFWEAIDRFCDAASLHRTITQSGPYGQVAPHVQINVGTGADYTAASYVGPFRLGPVTTHEFFHRDFIRRDLPKGGDPSKSDPFYAEIPIQSELNLIAIRIGPLKNLEAVDELGQSLLGSIPVTIPPYINGHGNQSYTISLARAAKPSKTLVRLKGLLPLEVGRKPAKPTSDVPLEGSTGKTIRDGDLVVTIREYKVDESGRVTIKLSGKIDGKRGEADPERPYLQSLRLATIFNGQVEFADDRNRSVWLNGGGGRNQNEFTQDYTFYPSGNNGVTTPAPTRIRIFRPEWTTWDLPFAFENVPLP